MYYDRNLVCYNPNIVCDESNLSPTQQRLYEHFLLAKMDVEKDAAKKINSLQAHNMKQMQNEYERELKKAQYEELGVKSGIVQVTTCNLRNRMAPIEVVNFQQPVLEILRRIADDIDIVYRIEFTLDGCLKAIFLNKKKSGKGSYLLQKFASEGAVFYANSMAKKKEYVCLLLAYLLRQSPNILWVAEDEGWTEFPGLGLRYVDKGELTWKKIYKLSQ